MEKVKKTKKGERIITLSLLLFLVFSIAPRQSLFAQSEEESWTFVSIPDFLNVDVNYPEPKWDDALDYTLATLKGEDPDFVLVAGDMVMGRWWRTEEQIEYMADIYYTAWTDRMKKFGLKYYVAVGDHEVGDNPWLLQGRKDDRIMGTWDGTPIEFFPFYEKAYVKHFQMPNNGSEEKKGLDYFVEHKNALIVTLDVFDQELIAEHGGAELTQKQLQWLDSVLAAKKDFKFKIVQAHTPILGPVRKKNSSGLMYRGGEESPLWQMLKKHNVDLYLCGEVHAITSIEQDGILQVSHGSLFGYNEEAHYLTGTVTDNEIQLELKWIPLELSGRRLQQSGGNEPYEYVTISAENKEKGFDSVGTVTLRKKDKKKEFIDKTGYFLEDDNPN